jgi:hypothetical protein
MASVGGAGGASGSGSGPKEVSPPPDPKDLHVEYLKNKGHTSFHKMWLTSLHPWQVFVFCFVVNMIILLTSSSINKPRTTLILYIACLALMVYAQVNRSGIKNEVEAQVIRHGEADTRTGFFS